MIKISELNKTYNINKPNAYHALHDISLTIDDGELTAIIGRSGAGKSTLLHIIGCIDRFESGTFEIDGEDVSKLSDKRLSKIRNQKVGIVMQDFALIDAYSVLQNVMTPLYFSKIKGKKAKEMCISALKAVNMEAYANKPINNLSGGQKQRIAIARAIVNDPSFILADEPTGALDTKTSEEIMQLFKELNRTGKTIIIITHDMTVAKACSRQIEISDGRIVSDSQLNDKTDARMSDKPNAETDRKNDNTPSNKTDNKPTDKTKGKSAGRTNSRSGSKNKRKKDSERNISI